MADNRSEYTVDIGGVPHTLLLDEETADRYGDRAVRVKQSKTPENKARSAENKDA